MLRTRLWMGAVLIALVVGVLVVDQWLAPAYPFLFALVLALAAVACWELLALLPAARRPAPWLGFAAVVAIIVVNWVPHLGVLPESWDRDPWHWILGTLTGVVLAAFLVEMANFREPGESVPRIALAVWLAAYLGLLPSFLAQLRWLDNVRTVSGVERGTVCIALAVFVPKCCDIGAYFTGRFLGRHKMAPVLSAKKTWEGAAGGIALAVVAAVAIDRLGPVLPNLGVEAAFGVTVGAAGMLGDLAESLVKRDLRHKDASQAVPGFGGVLDVVDAVIFAAPVAYGWLK
jgi:phosphatidate cytidylyltransferase